MTESTVQEVSLAEAKTIINGWWRYILSKWLWIGLIGIAFGLLGIYYASIQKPVYTASLTFAPNADNTSMGGIAGMAAQFGMNVGGSSSFEGDNLIYLLRSRNLLEKTFLTQVDINGKKQLLIDYVVSTQNVGSTQEAAPSRAAFSSGYKPGNRVLDSVMKGYITGIQGVLNIDKLDRRLDIVLVTLQHTDELFAKLFVESLVENAIQYYTDFKSQKSKQNVSILQRQVDSVKSLISGGIVSIAVSTDLNINPMKQVMRTGAQRKAVDVEANKGLYKELLTYLQAARMSLLKETPFIQIIDPPVLPLDKKKLGRAKAGIIFGVIGLFLGALFFSIKRMF